LAIEFSPPWAKEKSIVKEQNGVNWSKSCYPEEKRVEKLVGKESLAPLRRG